LKSALAVGILFASARDRERTEEVAGWFQKPFHLSQFLRLLGQAFVWFAHDLCEEGVRGLGSLMLEELCIGSLVLVRDWSYSVEQVVIERVACGREDFVLSDLSHKTY